MSKHTTWTANRSVQVRFKEGDTLGYVVVNLELNIDLGRIIDQLHRKALRNKSGRTKIVNGAVVLTVTRGLPKGARLIGY
jgi:hypothetical protein